MKTRWQFWLLPLLALGLLLSVFEVNTGEIVIPGAMPTMRIYSRRFQQTVVPRVRFRPGNE